MKLKRLNISKYIQPAHSMTSLICSDPPRMVFSDPYKVGGALQAILEGSLQTKDVIDGAGCMYITYCNVAFSRDF